MPYVSKAEQQAQQERVKWIGLPELVGIVQAESNCSVETAREQIRAALADGAICPLRWEPAPPESAYCHPRWNVGARLPTLHELFDLGSPPPSRNGWIDCRPVPHWQAVEIDWEQGRVLDDFERKAYPAMRKQWLANELRPTRPPKPWKPAWRTLWLDREGSARLWPPVRHVTSPTPPTISEAAAVVRDVQCLQAEELSNETADRGRVMPKYHLVSDLLNDLMIESGDSEQSGSLLIIINDEWDEGNIELLIRRTGEETPKVLEPLQRKLSLNRMASGERWIRCGISSRNDWGGIVPEFENPFISDKHAQYVIRKAEAVWLALMGRSNDTEMQPSQPDGAAFSMQSEVPSGATATRIISKPDLEKFVRHNKHLSENALWSAAKHMFVNKRISRQKIRGAIDAVRGRSGRTGRPKKSPEKLARIKSPSNSDFDGEFFACAESAS